MARLEIPPTKSSLLDTKRSLGFAEEGFDMLDQKRQILVLELMGMAESAKRVQQDVQEKMTKAFAALREALIRAGTHRLTQDAAAPSPDHAVQVESRSLMGLYLPEVSSEHPEARPVVSLLAGTPASDEVGRSFRDALETIDRLAEVENSVFRLAREVRKTQRRVNALEKVFIPAYEDTLAFITSVLEERERDEFVIMRIIKERLQERRRNSRENQVPSKG